MELKDTISTIPHNYWITAATNKKCKPDVSKVDSKANIMAMIVTCVTDNFPELINCKDSQFEKFQKQLQQILKLI